MPTYGPFLGILIDQANYGTAQFTVVGHAILVVTGQDQPVVEGKWKYTGGDGSFAGIIGGGTFKTKLTSPTALEATWEGAYELAGARAKAV